MGSQKWEINNEFSSFERRFNNAHNPPLASHVLVLMITGIFFSKLKHPPAFYPSTGATSAQLFNILWEAADILKFTRFKVCALVSDGAAPNRYLYSMYTAVNMALPVLPPTPLTTQTVQQEDYTLYNITKFKTLLYFV